MASANPIRQQLRGLGKEHLSAIQALADETHRPVDDINRIYTDTFEQLNADARIKDYLVVLASKRVRDRLRQPR